METPTVFQGKDVQKKQQQKPLNIFSYKTVLGELLSLLRTFFYIIFNNTSNFFP